MSLSRLQRFQYFAWAAGTLWTSRNRSCPASNGTDTSLIKRKYLFTSLWHCASCDLRFRVPKDDPPSSAEFYQERYTQGVTTDCPSDTVLASLTLRSHECLGCADLQEHCHATRIVVPSSFVRRTLIENGVSIDKIVVIPFGVDLNAFHPVLRRVMSRPLRFVFVGSMCARKGLPLLLEACRSLAPQNAELWLVGPLSECVARLIPAIKGLRIRKVPGSEVPYFLRHCEVLVFPSYFEGLAQVQLEAMASGIPIISTEVSGTRRSLLRVRRVS